MPVAVKGDRSISFNFNRSPDWEWLTVEVFDQEESQFHIAPVNWMMKKKQVLTDPTQQYRQVPVFINKAG